MSDHEIHRRRLSRNIALGLLLGGLVALIFAVTVVKLTGGMTTDWKGY